MENAVIELNAILKILSFSRGTDRIAANIAKLPELVSLSNRGASEADMVAAPADTLDWPHRTHQPH
jgi:hypothetical protein